MWLAAESVVPSVMGRPPPFVRAEAYLAVFEGRTGDAETER